MTRQEYFAVPAMSNSTFRHFAECESRGLALWRGEWRQESSDAMRAGSVCDAILTGTPEEVAEWLAKGTKQRGGGRYAWCEDGERMAESLLNDRGYLNLTTGALTQVPLFGKIGGLDWKVLPDYICAPGTDAEMVVDLKTCGNFDEIWIATPAGNVKLPWYDGKGYIRQMAIQQELRRQTTGQRPRAAILGVSNHNPPGKRLVMLDSDEMQARLDAEIDMLASCAERLRGLIDGTIEPTKCGACDWCRSQAVLADCVESGISRRGNSGGFYGSILG